MTNVLALDLATTTGFAVGAVGCMQPRFGAVRFGGVSASREVIFADALRWASATFREIDPQSSLVVWEAPRPTSFRRGHTTVQATAILFGLPAIIGAVAQLLQIKTRAADARDVRNHFIGTNAKRVVAKRQTKLVCRALGWNVTGDDEADALALWHYTCSVLNPKQALRPTPLFLRAGK